MSLTKSILLFKESATDEEIDEVKRKILESGGRILQDFRSFMKSFSVELTEEHFEDLQLQASVNDSVIQAIELDSIVTALD